MAPNKILFITGNANKLREVGQILGNSGILVESKVLDIPEIQGTTEEVSKAKCRRAAELVNGPCLVDDTALCFKALNGLPGPYIKEFLEKLGHDGIVKLLKGFDTSEATAVATFAYSPGPTVEPILFIGETQGQIVPRRGPTGFGWDACFEPIGYNQTYAEMPSDLKNGLSHRFKALEKLVKYLNTLE